MSAPDYFAERKANLEKIVNKIHGLDDFTSEVFQALIEAYELGKAHGRVEGQSDLRAEMSEGVR